VTRFDFAKKCYAVYESLRCKLFLYTYLNVMRMADVSVGKGVFIHWRSIIRSNTTIGDYTRINGPIFIRADAGVDIGKYCAIGFDVAIISAEHLMTHANIQYRLQDRSGFVSLDNSRPVTVGNNVWIGDRATILSGVNVGNGAVIGACSVVTKDVPPFSVVAGVPARVIRRRFSNAVIKKLLEIRWWDWSVERIRRNRRFFEADLTGISAKKLESLIVK
jgi:acetyltransferase-like isoleucine patch superfamily enzyme